MDSGNSGSMQSSSGDDQEYDSRGESISNLLHNPNFAAPNPSFLSQQPTFFDHNSQNQLNFPQYNNNSGGDAHLIWPRGLRSDLNNFNTFATASSSSSSPSISSSNTLILHQNPFSAGSASVQIQSSSMAQQPERQNVVKNPKKRTRASRRAPTTVLTTDTTNFRQMVQEFTGIPTAPFTGSPYSRRLDLFSTAGSAMRSGHLDSLGPLYPLRPSPQKVQVSPFMPSCSSSSLLSSTMIDALMPGTNSNAIGTSTSTNFQLGSDVGIQKQTAPQNSLFSMQNQILSFKPQSQGGSTSSMVPTLDELGISSANLSGFGLSGQTRNDENFSRLWNNMRSHDGGQENQLSSNFDNNNNNNSSSSQHVSSGYKLNSSSTSEFDKGLENVCDHPPVPSWTCPSAN